MTSAKSRNLNQRDDILNIIVGGGEGTGQSGLAPFFSLGSSEDLVQSVLETNPEDALDPIIAQANSDVLGGGIVHDIVKRAVLDTVKGAFTVRDLVYHLEEQIAGLVGDEKAQAEENLLRLITINSSAEIAQKQFGSNETIGEMLNISEDVINSKDPSKPTPGLSSIMLHPVGISPGTKNVAALTLFMNAIPTMEFSRAMPYVEMTMQVARPALTADGRPNTPSTVKFLLGARQLDEGTADYSMQTAASGTLEGAANIGDNASTAGMELFLGPQTMAPVPGTTGYDEMNAPSLRATPIIDPFRPLLSLESINIDVAASTGFMSFKTATVTLTVHDRSRLHEVADFVKPDLFGKTEFLIEYGWYHPMDSNDQHDYLQNPWGALLNAMRVKEKYGIVNSSFTMQGDGSVQVTLELAMKGANEYKSTLVGSDIEVQKAAQYIDELQERVSELRSSLTSKLHGGVQNTKSVLGSQILDAAQSTNGSPDIERKLRRKLNSTMRRLESLDSKDAVQLAETLGELYGTSKSDEGSAVKRLRTSIAEVINKKFQAIENPERGALVDPYFIEAVSNLRRKEFVTLLDSPSEYVTLGKVLMNFVAAPLASTLRFDDVQMLFYTFNASAGAIRNTSTAGFLIKKEELRREFDSYVLERRGTGMSVGEFMNFITQTFVDNMAALSYGMSTIYQKDKEGKIKPNAKTFRGQKDKDIRAAQEAEQKLLKMGVPDGVFKMPQLDLHIECLPGRPTKGNEGQASDALDEKTILRIHVFDKAATAYETQSQLIAASRDAQLSAISFTDDVDKDDLGMQKLRANTYVNAAVSTGILEGVPGTESSNNDPEGSKYSHYRLVGGPQAVKEFVRSTAPNIIYGAQNTAVEELSLASIQDPALSTVNMLRTDRAGSVTPEGSGRGGVPLKTIPAEASVTTMGCPLLSFTQQFFIDAGTGTDLDNLYAITSLQHTIEPGVFKSSFQLTPLQGYGKYESTVNRTEAALAELDTLIANAETDR